MTLSKTQKLLNYLKRGGSITGNTAMSRFHIYRLSSCILRYRRKGVNVVTQKVTYRGEEYAKYFIK